MSLFMLRLFPVLQFLLPFGGCFGVVVVVCSVRLR